jgi:hypothetical protein
MTKLFLAALSTLIETGGARVAAAISNSSLEPI